MVAICYHLFMKNTDAVLAAPQDLIDGLVQDVLKAYDWDVTGQAHEARAAAIDVLAASRTQLLATVGQVTAQRQALAAALRSAISWLPVTELPDMAQLRKALLEATAESVAEAAPRVSHGICLPCVQRLYPQYTERVRATVAATTVAAVAGFVRICCGCGASLSKPGPSALGVGLAVALSALAGGCVKTELVAAPQLAVVSVQHEHDAAIGVALLACIRELRHEPALHRSYSGVWHEIQVGRDFSGVSAACVPSAALLACQSRQPWDGVDKYFQTNPGETCTTVAATVDQARALRAAR